MAVCTWTLLNEPWDALGTWGDFDSYGGISEIDPAGELHLDCRALTEDGTAERSKSSEFLIGTGNYTVYMKFKGDTWDGNGVVCESGIRLYIQAETNILILVIGNQCDGNNDGIWLFDGNSYVHVFTKTWDNNWHTIRVNVHNSQTDADIYIDDEVNPSVTDGDCSISSPVDGSVIILGKGTVSGNGEYHIDYLKINSGNCDPLEFGNITQTLTTKGNIKRSLLQTITIKTRIKKLFIQTLISKANIKSISTQTIQVKADIGRHYRYIDSKSSILNQVTQSINVKGYIPNIKTQSLKSLARINPSQTFIDEVDKTIRQISRKLEIQWDGVNWTDESVYLINAQGNEKLSKTSGEGIASVLDVDLDNTDERFTPNNTSSPICAYIKPRVNIRLSIIMGSYTYRMFTGYIKNIHPDTRSRVCSLECFDNQVLVYNKRANGVVYEDKRSDQLLTTLAGLADLTSDQYEFDIGTLIVNFGYFEDRNVWPVMGELAVAERGRVFFDRNGILKFWNRDRLHNRGYSITLTLNDWISDLDYSVAEHEIKNAVIVQATPRASAGVQVVWTSGNAAYLNPYSDTLVWIPSGGSQVAWLELEDPCTTFITPIRNTDFTANSTQDGSGDDLTNNIEIHEFINYGNAVYITVGNVGDTDAYLTKFQIRGNPARILKWIRVTAKDQSSIDRYGRQDFQIENNFIQDEGAATEIANEELWRRKDAVNLFRINIIGIPYLLCGDVVRVEYRASEYDNHMIDQLDWTLDDSGFKQKLTLVNPYIFPTVQRVNARGYIVKYHQSKTATSKGRIRATKIITAKGNIFANTSKTIETFGNIV